MGTLGFGSPSQFRRRPFLRAVHGAVGGQGPQRLTGPEAVKAGREQNATVVDGAIDWVAAHPDYAWFKIRADDVNSEPLAKGPEIARRGRRLIWSRVCTQRVPLFQKAHIALRQR